MRLLITGSTGMVGSNLKEHQDAANYEILAPLREQLNLLDYNATYEYLKKNKPDLIIHAAGLVGGIMANIRNPVSFFVNNFDMGRNIVLAARNTGVKRLINLGSSCMYPRNAVNPLKEEMVLQGELEPTNEGYALAKVSISRLCDYVVKEDCNYKYITLIPCNLYGRWDKFDLNNAHMIPAAIHKMHTSKVTGAQSVTIWGDGKAYREFMYAGDLADCVYYTVMHFDQAPFSMNVGLGFDYSILEYYKTVAEVINYEGEFLFDLSKPKGMKRKLVDIDRQIKFGWKSTTSLVEGIQKTYQFYLEHM